MSTGAINELLESLHPNMQKKISYMVHDPEMTRAITAKKFHYFKLKLVDIPRFFKVKKSWNHNYPAAQHIYSGTPAALALQAAIHAEHAILYSGRWWRRRTARGKLERNATAFFDLLAKYGDTKHVRFTKLHRCFASIRDSVVCIFGPKKENEPKHESTDESEEKEREIYTYSLMDNSIRFSRSSAWTNIDMASKHALHAGGAPEVFYAGEFWIEGGPEEKTLYIDNNSGTFAPPKEDLFRMKLLMETNFPGMKVVVLDYQDPLWKEKRKKMS
jgi:hypothetical protein